MWTSVYKLCRLPSQAADGSTLLWVIEFYAPWCRHCVDHANDYKVAAERCAESSAACLPFRDRSRLDSPRLDSTRLDSNRESPRTTVLCLLTPRGCSMDGEVEFGAVNCVANKQLCGRFGINAYPTVTMFSPRSDQEGP